MTVSIEDPADFLDVMTPARVRILKQINGRAVAIFALASALFRDPSAVRRDVALLESKHLVRSRKVAHPGHGNRALVERVAGPDRPIGNRLALVTPGLDAGERRTSHPSNVNWIAIRPFGPQNIPTAAAGPQTNQEARYPGRH